MRFTFLPLTCCILLNYGVCSAEGLQSDTREIILKNEYFQRVFWINAEEFKTESFCTDSHKLISGIPSEATVVLNGQSFVIGKQGGFSYRDHRIERAVANVERLVVSFKHDEFPSLDVELIYDIRTDLPVLIKCLRIRNNGPMVQLNSAVVEQFTPVIGGPKKLVFDADYVRGAVQIEGKAVYSPWIEKHHHYINTFLNPQPKPTIFTYPVKLEKSLAKGETFESFRVFEFLLTSETNEAGLEFRRITRVLFPWTRKQFLACYVASAVRSVQEYYQAIDQAAEVGLEGISLHHYWVDRVLTSPLFTNYNDYQLRPDLFPKGLEDVRKLTDYAHSKGLKIGFYAIHCQTWRNPEESPEVMRHNEWEQKWAKDDNSQRWGVTLDPGTGWGAFVSEKIKDTIVKGGFDCLMIDGPYYGDVNVNPKILDWPNGANQYVGWNHLKNLYNSLENNGVQVEAAQGFCAFANGMSRITTTGYVEGDFGKMDIPSQINATRKAAYNFTKLYRPEQATTFFPVVPWSPNPKAPSLMPMEENCAFYNLYLATCYGYGFEGKPFTRLLYDGPKSKAAVQRWVGFWKKYNRFIKEGYLFHLKEPDNKSVDAIMHVLAEQGKIKALVVAFNPTNQALEAQLDLRLNNFDTNGASCRIVDEAGAETYSTSDKVMVRIGPYGAQWFEVFF